MKAFREKAVIPTFKIDKGRPAPAIFELEETRGAYPRSILDAAGRSPDPVEREYELLVLESDLLRVEVLAEVGGRVWRIIDKPSGRNLLWTNRAIKPVDVGRRRGWIEGGIEFPFPVSNHGEDTIEPYRSALREDADGGAAITVSSFDHHYRFWSSYDIALAPGERRLAITTRLYNPTAVRNRYQIWVNAAVPASEDMQFVFPVDYIAGHGFKGVRPWPMWDAGSHDRSFWRNQKEMLGVFGWNADFFGVYYHDGDCGVIRYCPHEKAEGIKAWTWGTDSRWTAEYGLEQGPCVEIQRGRWPTQTMYGWLEPHQRDEWTEYFYPVHGLGGVHEAGADAAVSVNVEQSDGDGRRACVRVNVTRPIEGELTVRAPDGTHLNRKVSLDVSDVLVETVDVGAADDAERLRIELKETGGGTVLHYDRPLVGTRPSPPREPASIVVEGTGPAWEQFRAALSAELLDGDNESACEQYEALLDHHGDFAEAWKALGILRYKQGEAAEAREALSKAAALDGRDGETAYYLGLAEMELNEAEAAAVLERLGDDKVFGAPALVTAGRAALRADRVPEAAALFTKACRAREGDSMARDYLALAARIAGDEATSRKALAAALSAEPMDPFAGVERLFASGAASGESISEALGTDDDLYVEVAFYYDAAGRSAEALEVVEAGLPRAASAMYYYQAAYFAGKVGRADLSRGYAAKADEMGCDYVFPHRREDFAVLRAAGVMENSTGSARYHEGTLTYWLGKSAKALDIWVGMLGKYKVAGLYHRVADAYSKGKVTRAYDSAIDMYRRAVEEDERDIQVYYSLDDLYEKTGDVHTRHDLLRRGLELFPDDDEMAIRMARCFNRRKWSGKAAEVLENHSFHRRHQSWHLMQMAREAIEETYGLLAIEAIRDGDRERALANIEKASRAQEKTREWFD
ncbi:MAG: DUF5107 domain-containing protein [Planctomycetota bacterium]